MNTQTPDTDTDDDGYVGEAGAAELFVDRSVQLKTITMASIGAAPERAKSLGRRVLLAEIRGVITGLREEEGVTVRDRMFVALVAADGFDAEVVDETSGEIVSYRAQQCYLPTVWHTGAVDAAIRRGIGIQRLGDEPPAPGEKGVPFILEFYSIPARSPVGYTYTARSLLRIDRRAQSPGQRLADESRLVKAMLRGPGPDDRKRLTSTD